MKNLKEHILQLEKDLLKPEVRRSVERIRELVADDFTEFCSSGFIYHYDKGDTWGTGDGQALNWEIRDFDIKELSLECVLVTYKVIKHDEIDENKKYTLRSSVWKSFGGKWKMIFHQGTILQVK